MKTSTVIRTTALAVAVAALFASSAIAASPHATVTIRHQTRGCHAWSYDGGAYKAALKITLARGTALTVIDNDVMPHKLRQLSGPKATLVTPAMNHMSARATVVFAHNGTYTFATKAGEDYVKGIKTIGPDNILRLTVTVL